MPIHPALLAVLILGAVYEATQNEREEKPQDVQPHGVAPAQEKPDGQSSARRDPPLDDALLPADARVSRARRRDLVFPPHWLDGP